MEPEVHFPNPKASLRYCSESDEHVFHFRALIRYDPFQYCHPIYI